MLQHLKRPAASGAVRAFPRSTNKVAQKNPMLCMLSTGRLSEEEKADALATLASGPFVWENVPDRNAIRKSFHFADFNQAWSFMSRVALVAEKMDHHPEWFNVYSTVDVTLTTHDCQGVSKKDIEMAEKMDSFAASLLPPRGS